MQNHGRSETDCDDKHEDLAPTAIYSELDVSMDALAPAPTSSMHSQMPFDMPSLWNFTRSQQSTSSTPIPHPPFIFNGNSAGSLQHDWTGCIDPQKVMERHQASSHCYWPSGPPWAHPLPQSPIKSSPCIDTTNHVAPGTEGGNMSCFVNHDILAPSISQTSSQGSQIPSPAHFPLNLHYDYGLGRQDAFTAAAVTSSWPNSLISTSGGLTHASADRKHSWLTSQSQSSASVGAYSMNMAASNQIPNHDDDHRRLLIDPAAPVDLRPFADGDRMPGLPASHRNQPSQLELALTAPALTTDTRTSSSHSACACEKSCMRTDQDLSHMPVPDANSAAFEEDTSVSSSFSTRRSQKLSKKVYQCNKCVMSELHISN